MTWIHISPTLTFVPNLPTNRCIKQSNIIDDKHRSIEEPRANGKAKGLILCIT